MRNGFGFEISNGFDIIFEGLNMYAIRLFINRYFPLKRLDGSFVDYTLLCGELTLIMLTVIESPLIYIMNRIVLCNLHSICVITLTLHNHNNKTILY